MDSLISVVIIVLLVIFFGSLVKRFVHHTTVVMDNLLEATADASAVVRISAAVYKNSALKEASAKLGDEPLNEQELIAKLRGE